MRGITQWTLLIPLVFANGAHLPAQNILNDPAFDHFYNLEYDEALAGFQAEAAKTPDDSGPYNHIAQTILYREMLRGGMLQSQMLTRSNSFLKTPKLPMKAGDREEFMNSINRAIDLAQGRLDRNPRDTGALYSLGVSFALRGNYDFAVCKAYLDALRDMTAARKFHNQATRIDPNFVDAQLLQGVYDYIVGSLPLGWKMLGFLAGFHGNRERGIATLERVAREGNIDRIDAAVALAAIYRRENRPGDAICVLNPLIVELPRNYLLRLELAEMYGDQGDRSAALAELDCVERLRCAHAPGYQRLTPEAVQKVRQEILRKIGATGASTTG